MTQDVEESLHSMGLRLPDAPAPAANYLPYKRAGDLLHVSGQLPFRDGTIVTGRLGEDADLSIGIEAARLCALGLLAQVRAATGGDWSRLAHAVKLVGFVASAPGFTDQPRVINGASDLLVAALGDRGRHARSAVGVAALPLGAAVEVEGVFRLR